MRRRSFVVGVFVFVLLVGLPLAVWLDLRYVTKTELDTQAKALSTAITGIRDFYSSDVAGRVQDANGHAVVTAQYQTVPGGIPIPATFSLDLGDVVGAGQSNVGYRFVSQFPFKFRKPHKMDAFEHSALSRLALNPNLTMRDVRYDGLNTEVRYVTPIIMEQSCVACHNADPDSPKRDWKIGDVGGFQELSINEPIAPSIFSFRYLLTYFVVAAAIGVAFLSLQYRQSRAIALANTELASKNDFLASISQQLSRYLSPQIFRSIFSGEKNVQVQTERKKLTIFFSDIKDFTSTSERLEPEELTALLNGYFTAMSAIALEYGGTIDKFVGDAMLVFFGDPETRGTAQDAEACVRMAVTMQAKVAELAATWRRAGIEEPFRARMGITTGYCNVGNFGSLDRLDYTIIGGEVNLAARLQSIAEPGTIILSYETFALVRDVVAAHPLAPIQVKGIAREVVPYVLDGLRDKSGTVVSEHAPGVDIFIDVDRLDAAASSRARKALEAALSSLNRSDEAGAS